MRAEIVVAAAASGDLVAVHAGQADVEQDQVGPTPLDQSPSGRRPVIGHLDVLAEARGAGRRGCWRSTVVVDHEDAAAWRLRGARRRRSGQRPMHRQPSARLGVGRDRQADGELAAPARAVAVGRHRPRVHLHQRADQGQADPQAALATDRERLVGLGEQVEDVGEQLRRDADAVVADADQRLRPLLRGLQPRSRRRCVGVLGGVVQEVGDTCASRRRVDLQRDRGGRGAIRSGGGP